MADTTTSPPPRPVREKGYAADMTNWWVDLTHETTPELRWPLSVAVFDKMRRQDAQVASVLQAVKSPIIRTQWWVDGTGCDAEVTKFVASNLGLPIKDQDPADANKAQLRGETRFNWDEHVRLALLMLPFGHMFFEQTYSWDGARWRLASLGPRLPRSISRVSVARNGDLVSIEQFGSLLGTTGGISSQFGNASPILANRLVAYVLEREGGNWLGQSLLRSAYKNWLLKDKALRTWLTSIDRNGTGIPVATAAQDAKDLSLYEDIATSVRSGDNAGAALPFGATLELKGVTGALPDIDKFVRYQDEQIARSALGHFLNLGTQVGGQVGSYNLGSVLSNTFNLSLDAVAGLIKNTADAHIIEDLVDLNFGKTVPAPQLVYDEVGSQTSELDKVREAAGLQSDADLVKFIQTVPQTTQEAAG